MSTRHTVLPSPIGPLTVVAAGDALIGLYFDGHTRPPRDADLGPDEADDPLFTTTARQLAEYFAATRTEFDLPLAPRGSPFEQRVWSVLTTIPHGETRTYAQIATILGTSNAAQAVGNANGWNPISIVIPCHRLIGSNGSLTGYAGGVSRKRFLLDLEQPASLRLF